MNLEAIRGFMGALGVHNVVYAGGEFAQCSCVLAPFKHRAGVDRNPSFGISLNKPLYNCYVCGAGSLAQLLGEIDMHVQRRPELKPRYDTASARTILRTETETVLPLPPYAEFTPSPYQEFQEWPDYVLDDFPPCAKIPKLVQYLKSRGVAPETAVAFDLRYDYAKDMCVAPFRNASGRLSGMRGRGLTQKRHFDYTWNKVNNIGLVWYNEEAFNLPGPLVVVEGQFDVMRVWPHHPKVVAILSSTASLYKKNKLVACNCPVALMLDNDETGRLQTFGIPEREGWLAFLTDHGVEAFAVQYPDDATFKDPGEAPESWLSAVAQELKTV